MWGMGVAEVEGDALAGDIPGGVEAVRCWTYRDVDCAVGSVGGSLYGFARMAGSHSGWSKYRPADDPDTFGPRNLGSWLVLDVSPLSRYWSQEVLSRLSTTGSSELVAWDVHGYAWGIEKIRGEVNGFVDAVLREVPEQRRADEAGPGSR